MKPIFDVPSSRKQLRALTYKSVGSVTVMKNSFRYKWRHWSSIDKPDAWTKMEGAPFRLHAHSCAEERYVIHKSPSNLYICVTSLDSVSRLICS